MNQPVLLLLLEVLMKTLTLNTAWQRSSGWARSLAWVSLAAGVWALSAGAAQARDGRDVYWSIGVNQPGVSVWVSNAPPVVYRQRPQVVVVERPVIYARPVVVYETRPYVYERPAVVYGDRGYRRVEARRGHKYKKSHKRNNRHGDRWND
jgi:hypothetical protein